jgi:putative SOS response-associated peptidase YedK
MCGRFTLVKPGKIKFQRMGQPTQPLFPRYNIAPSQTVLAIADFGAGVEWSSLTWALVPSWSKDGKGFINARSETLEEKASFSESFRERRCLIPADGFFEWRRAGRAKQPFYFQLRDEGAFAFAGVWDRWRNGGNSVVSCAIITTEANELLSPIHDRMPVILQPDAYEAWLDPKTDPVVLKRLLQPFPASEMKSYPVGSAVNHPDNDTAEIIVRVDAEPGTTPSLF